MSIKLTNTWGTDKAILERALDKTGDIMTGDLDMQGNLIMNGKMLDGHGNEAISLDSENKTIQFYGGSTAKVKIGSCDITDRSFDIPLDFQPKVVLCNIHGSALFIPYLATNLTAANPASNGVYAVSLSLSWTESNLHVSMTGSYLPTGTLNYILIS